MDDMLGEAVYLIQSSIYFDQIVLLDEALKKAGIEYVFLKGLPTYLHYFETHPRRPYSDCDLLVPPKTISRVENTFSRFGYKPMKDFADSEYSRRLKTTIHDLIVVFDVHISVAFRVDKSTSLRLTEEMLKSRHRKTVLIHSTRLPVLKPESLILYLLIHLYTHNWQGEHRFEYLKRLSTDLEKKAEINWNRIIRLAEKLEIVSLIAPGLFMLARHHKYDLPWIMLVNRHPNLLDQVT